MMPVDPRDLDHVRRVPAQTCYYCTRPATLLCDHPTARGQTCDRPLCPDHARRGGSYIACRRGKDGGSTTGTIDYCAEHAGAHGL